MGAFLIIGGICLIFLILALLFLFSTPRRVPEGSPPRRGKKKFKTRVYETGGSKLNKADRREMLENVRNLAAAHPGRTAAVLRDWMQEEDKKN